MPAAILRHPGTSKSSLSGSMTFPEFLDYLMEGAERGTRGYALDFGVDEKALLRYANGACSVYERQEIQNVIVRNAWARNFVVEVVKRKRRAREDRKRNAA